MSTPATHFAGSSLETVLRTAPLGALENRILLGHVLGLSRVQLITQSQRCLSPAEADVLASLLARRLAGEPIAYLVGMREFYGLALRVTPAVLIPRPETELLVELAMQYLPPGGCMLDMGTGSGAIALAVAHTRADAQVSALDASPAALEVARENAHAHGLNIDFMLSDWYRALAPARPQFDVIAANPPYIVAGDAHLSQGDLRFEPVDALTDHSDGLSALRQIVAGAPGFLKPGGWLLMEHGYDQAQAVRALLATAGFAEVQSWKDLADIERVSGARLK